MRAPEKTAGTLFLSHIILTEVSIIPKLDFVSWVIYRLIYDAECGLVIRYINELDARYYVSSGIDVVWSISVAA